MNKDQHPLNKLSRHIKLYGTKGLLPHNLTDELLDRMNLEGDAIENDTSENIPSSTLLTAIIYLLDGKKITKNTKIEIKPELLMDYFSLYITALRLEDMRRKKDIEIEDKFLPTEKNIFDKKRTIDIKWMDDSSLN